MGNDLSTTVEQQLPAAEDRSCCMQGGGREVSVMTAIDRSIISKTPAKEQYGVGLVRFVCIGRLLATKIWNLD